MKAKTWSVTTLWAALVSNLILCSASAGAAEFTAEIAISGPGDGYTYSLHVKGPLYRIQKTQGPMNVPPFPSIVNRDTGMTWGLMPSLSQYVEIPDLEKTFLANPLVGWAMTRKGMIESPGPVETLDGYACETRVYTAAGGSEPAAKVWFAKELGHILREERFGGNEHAVLALRNVQEGPVDDALFQIPEGFTRVSMEGAPAPAGAAADPSPPSSSDEERSSAARLMFILDASGSMWGQVDGTAKIAIAKEVLTELVRDLPDDAVVGLVAYGHRRKGDCGDVEELISLGPLDRNRVIEIVQGLSPKGKTPITLSVQKTVDRIRHVEEETTIILVSDGKETCGGDPCALVRELRQAGIRFMLHVVGFDVTEEERLQLECMAEAGGGEYYTAKTAHEFRAAARKAVQKTKKEQGFLRLTALRGDEPFRAAVEVREAGGERVVKSGRTGTDPDRAGAPVKPGTYDLRFRDADLPDSPEVWVRGVEVAAGETVERVAVFAESGLLSVKAVKNNAPMKAYVKVFRQEDEKYFGDGWTGEDGTAVTFELLPGVYKVWLQDRSVKQRPEQWIEDVEVKAGEDVERFAAFVQGGALRITATREGAPNKAYVKVFQQEDDRYLGDGWSRTDGGAAEFDLLPGVYYARVKDAADSSVREVRDIRVTSGKAVTANAVFPVDAEPPAEESPEAPAPVPRPGTEKEKAPSGVDEPGEGGQGLQGGEIPIMPGAKVLKETAYGKSAQYELEVEAPLQTVLDYYAKAMADRGWPRGMVMNQAGKGAMMIQHEGRQFALKAAASENRTRFTLMLVQP